MKSDSLHSPFYYKNSLSIHVYMISTNFILIGGEGIQTQVSGVTKAKLYQLS